MKTNEIINVIDAYFAGKTTPEEERLLFSSLSQNAEGREYFKDSMLLKTALQTIEEPFPEHLDQKFSRKLSGVAGRNLCVNIYTRGFCPCMQSRSVLSFLLSSSSIKWNHINPR